MLEGKHIVLGITGSIAAYKACLLIRALVRRGAEVQVVITPAGKEFITPVTLSALSRNPVISDFFAGRDGTWHSHVDLGIWADAMIVAPCTASTLGKMANGIADNMLVTTYLSMKAPVFVAPAMDLDMYRHASTQENIARLRRRGDRIIEPTSGFLASGIEGKGRMEEPDTIADYIDDYFNAGSSHDLEGRKIVVTAGPTYERIDPVRFIGNYSTGKMGVAIAEECSRRGAEVVLIAGPMSLKCNKTIHRIDVESCAEMHDAAVKQFEDADAAILTAAVADFRASQVSEHKIKRAGDRLVLELRSTNDIAAALGRKKRSKQVLAAFALETDNEENNAMEKLAKKNADFIVLNSMRDAGTCFGSDDNKITIFDADGSRHSYEKKPKAGVAVDIVEHLVGIINAKNSL